MKRAYVRPTMVGERFVAKNMRQVLRMISMMDL